MDMQKILETINSCASLRKMAEESFPESRITQLNTIIANNFYDLSAIEKLYVGSEIAISGLRDIVEYNDGEKQQKNPESKTFKPLDFDKI